MTPDLHGHVVFFRRIEIKHSPFHSPLWALCRAGSQGFFSKDKLAFDTSQAMDLARIITGSSDLAAKRG